MGCEAGQCNEIFIPKGVFIFTVAQSLDRRATKANEAPSPHEVKLTLLDTNPVFQHIREKSI